MTIDEARNVWADQPAPQIAAEKLEHVVTSQLRAKRNALRVMTCFTVVCIACGILGFFGRVVIEGDDWLVSVLRSSIPLVIIPFQLQAWWSANREYQERRNSAMDQRSSLERIIDDLHRQVHRPGDWKLLLFFLAVFAMMGSAKWLDYQRGEDSLAECVLILGFFVSMTTIIFLAMWHHRNMFLMPRLKHLRSVLRSFDEVAEPPSI